MILPTINTSGSEFHLTGKIRNKSFSPYPSLKNEKDALGSLQIRIFIT